MTIGQSLRVLLLDDCEVMLELVEAMLDGLGASDILTAADGEQGLAVFDVSEPKPDILICDLKMPGMDGVEFLRNIAERGFEGGVILFSGADGAVLKAAERLAVAHGLNFLGILEKPVDEAALAALLAQRNRIGGVGRPAGDVQMLTPREVEAGLSEDRVEVFFQPKVSVRGRRLLGVECLARWRHPERGLLPPSAFIPVIEQHGMIDQFTLAVFRKAAAQQGAWLREGHAIKVNINFSMDNLLCLELPEILDGILHDAGLTAQDVVLEMTESRLLDNLKLSLDTLVRLRLKGFGLSIDDFGTGYSTMENLKHLPFTELKVDRAFVSGAAEDTAAHAILESSIRLGRTFGLNVVAEGVETQEDWDTVAALGCDEVQGYFVAKPMPAAELIDWKRRWEYNAERNEEMANKADILVVDDDIVMQELFAATLGGNYRIRASDSGREALAAAGSERPDLIILDVSMPPGMDGYETCRQLKADEGTADIPVIFVSGCDSIEDRLKGYEAGGDDYLIKPFDEQELEAKIVNLLKVAAERAELKQMATYASSAAMTAMSSLNELGLLLEAMKRFSACADYRELADAVLAGLALYNLAGAVQVRAADDILTRTTQGESSPLEVSVIAQMANMERIVQFKSRMLINYRRVSLLVHDMPTNDADRCGRLRDHLAMLAEAAEVRAEAIAATAESRRRGSAIEQAIARITTALDDIDLAQRENRIAARLAVEAVTERMERAFVSVALSTSQEDFMSGILKESIDHLLNTHTDVVSLQNKLSSLVQELKGMMEGRPGWQQSTQASAARPLPA